MRAERPAPLWRRAAAGLLDAALGFSAAALGALWLVTALALLRPGAPDAARVLVLAGAIAGLSVALHVVYHVGFVWGCGQTPGAMALGIAVASADGRAPGPWRAGARLLGGWLALLALGLPHAVPLLAGERRGFGDWLAGTWMVRT